MEKSWPIAAQYIFQMPTFQNLSKQLDIQMVGHHCENKPVSKPNVGSHKLAGFPKHEFLKQPVSKPSYGPNKLAGFPNIIVWRSQSPNLIFILRNALNFSNL